MTTIKKYCKHDITIVKVTLLRGRETTTEDTVKGYTSTVRIATRDVSGIHVEEKTVVFLVPDVDISRKDKIKIDDGVVMPILKITRPAFVGKSPNHIEVTLD